MKGSLQGSPCVPSLGEQPLQHVRQTGPTLTGPTNALLSSLFVVEISGDTSPSRSVIISADSEDEAVDEAAAQMGKATLVYPASQILPSVAVSSDVRGRKHLVISV
jgi:hypothetical protein